MFRHSSVPVAGHGEFFQGSLDDLRIYPVALTAEQIGQLHQHGTQALVVASVELQAELVKFYCDRPSFAATLAESRQRLPVAGVSLDRELGAAVLAKLKARFPQEYGKFFEWDGNQSPGVSRLERGRLSSAACRAADGSVDGISSVDRIATCQGHGRGPCRVGRGGSPGSAGRAPQVARRCGSVFTGVAGVGVRRRTAYPVSPGGLGSRCPVREAGNARDAQPDQR